MIAVDTNILVYAHREDSSLHKEAYAKISELAESRAAWCVPWTCIHEFLAIVTHPKIYNPPTPLPNALSQIRAWLEAPSLILLAETEGYWRQLESLVTGAKIQGPQFHDARIVALCMFHGVRELWTADRDFSRYPGLPTRNPLVS